MGEKRKSPMDALGAASGSAGLSAIAAALGLCCYGPLAVMMVGVTGAAWFSRFEPYRSYLLVAAGVLLAFAFWRVYSRPARPLAIQVVLWGSLLLLAGAALLPGIASQFIRIRPEGG